MKQPHLIPAALPLLCCLLGTGAPLLADAPEFLLSTRSPLSGSVIIDKRPILDCSVETEVSRDSVLVILDGTDVTALLEWQEGGFSYRPPVVLSSGRHVLQIVVTGDAAPSERSFGFESRHSDTYKTQQTDIDLSGEYAFAAVQSDTHATRSEFNAALGIASRFETQSWEHTFTSHLSYADPVLGEGGGSEKIVLNDFLFRSFYSGEQLGALLEIGDVTVDASETTLSAFSRRGMKLDLQYGGWTLNTFSVLGDTTYDFDEGLGAGTDASENVYGGSLAYAFLGGRAQVKLVYAEGGMHGNGFGTASESLLQEGNVAGILARADLIGGALSVEAEWDRAEFDADTGDALGPERDDAYHIGVSGAYGLLQYRVYQAFVGARYTPIGNPSLVNDKSGFGADAGLYGDAHSLNLSLSRFSDNTDDDPLVATVRTETGSLGYTYFGLPQWLFSLNYARTQQQSEDIPDGTARFETLQEDFGGSLQWSRQAWSYAFSLRYGTLNDRTAQGGDEESFDLSFSPSYSPGSRFVSSIAPTLGYLREKQPAADVASETYSLNLSIAGTLGTDRLCYSLYGTAQHKVYGNATPDETAYNASARLEYRFASPTYWMRPPSAGIKADFRQTDGQSAEGTERVYALRLFVNLPLTYSF